MVKIGPNSDIYASVNFTDDDYEGISRMANYMHPIYTDITKNYEVANVLDIGCGNGHFAGPLLEANYHIDGIDGHPQGLKKCLELGFRSCYFSENIDHDDLGALGQKYDLIICKDFLEHLIYPHRLLEQIKKVLSDKGLALIHVPNHFPLFYRLKFLCTGDVDTQNFFPKNDEWDNPHIKFFTYNGMLRLFEKTGLKVVKDYSYSFFYFAPGTISFLKSIGLAKLIYQLNPGLFTTGFTFLVGK